MVRSEIAAQLSADGFELREDATVTAVDSTVDTAWGTLTVRQASGQRRFSARQVDALLRGRCGGAQRCAVYARVSSNKQAEAGNLERQKERLLAAAADKGYELVTTERAGIRVEREAARPAAPVPPRGEW